MNTHNNPIETATPEFSLDVALKMYRETLAAEGEAAAGDFIQWVAATYQIADDGLYQKRG